MKNYILMLGVAGVALGSYCAYASNSATMTVTATIAHDVSLSVTRNISWTMTIDPSKTWGDVDCLNCVDGCEGSGDGGIIYASMTAGRFTANIPNPNNYENVLSFEESGYNGTSVGSDEYGDQFSILVTIDHVRDYEFAVSGMPYYNDIVPAPKVYDFGSLTIQYTPES